MKNWKKFISFLLALVMCLGLAACGGGSEDNPEENKPVQEPTEQNDGITLEDLEGFWYPVGGIGSTTSVLTCFYIDGAAGTWLEYDQYGDPTEYTGTAYTDGAFLTLEDVSFLWDVEDVSAPIGDADTLLDENGEVYWIKGEPDFKEKLGLSNVFGNWYYRGDHTSEFQMVLTLNEDGTYTWGDSEEGTYTCGEVDVSVTDANTNETRNEHRQEVKLSGGFMGTSFYVVNDGQVLVEWSKVNEGNEFYVHESALENGEIFKLYRITDGNDYWGSKYALQFLRENGLYRNYFNGAQDPEHGTWELSDDTITIIWDDGETDEATLNPDDPASLTLSSTGETFAKLF